MYDWTPNRADGAGFLAGARCCKVESPILHWGVGTAWRWIEAGPNLLIDDCGDGRPSVYCSMAADNCSRSTSTFPRKWKWLCHIVPAIVFFVLSLNGSSSHAVAQHVFQGAPRCGRLAWPTVAPKASPPPKVVQPASWVQQQTPQKQTPNDKTPKGKTATDTSPKGQTAEKQAAKPTKEAVERGGVAKAATESQPAGKQLGEGPDPLAKKFAEVLAHRRAEIAAAKARAEDARAEDAQQPPPAQTSNESAAESSATPAEADAEPPIIPVLVLTHAGDLTKVPRNAAHWAFDSHRKRLLKPVSARAGRAHDIGVEH